MFSARIALALLLCPWMAWAGTLYRCVDANGGVHLVSTAEKGMKCTVAAQYTAVPEPAKPANAPPAPVADPSVVQAGLATGPAPASADADKPKFLRMAHSTTYVWTDYDGVKHFASARPKGVSGVEVKRTSYPIFSIPACYACTLLPGVNFGNVRLNLSAYQAEVRAAAKRYGVDEAIVRAIIHAESAFRPHVVSPKNAQGLMQLIPATAKRFGVRDAFDPAQNIEGGVQYLAFLLKRYQNDLTLAAAAYNAGEGAVDRYKGVPPYKETRNYVARVGQLATRYRSALKSG